MELKINSKSSLTVKILVIDDDKVDRASLKKDLVNTNFVSEIVDAKTAFASVERFYKR